MYAASLYFEGRVSADDNATLEPSHTHWDYIDLVSLDNCLGHNSFGVPTATLISELNQATINTYVQSLGLPLVDRAFLMNRTDLHIIRYDGLAEEWYDDGMRLDSGTTANSPNQFNDMTTAELLEEPGQARLNAVALARGASMQPAWSVIPDKATIVNQKDAKRMMYNLATQTWGEVDNNDAVYHVHDRTHYADLMDSVGKPLLLAQIRCTVQSIMNTERPSVSGVPVAMPEMQFFGLPTETINNGTPATVAYLKAEDSTGNLHDILGKHVNLPHQSYANSRTYYRFYIGGVQNTAASNRLYLTLQNTSGTMTSPTSGTPANSSTTTNHKAIVNDSSLDLSESGDYRTSPTYFELYLYSSSNEKIILSSGYTGVPS